MGGDPNCDPHHSLIDLLQDGPKRHPGDTPRDSERHPRGLWPFCSSSPPPPPPTPPPPASLSPTSSSDSSSILPSWGMTASPVLCFSVCSHTTRIKATPQGIVAGKLTVSTLRWSGCFRM